MKFCACGLGVLLFSLGLASAQVTVEVTQDQEQFLPGEALPVAVRITNRSGQTLHLGAEDDWLSFIVEGRDGRVVEKSGDVPVVGEFELPPSKVAIKRVDLAPCFPVTTPGRYSITAVVRVRSWNQELTSPAKSFDLIEGTSLYEQEVGVPRTEGDTNSAPEVRRYLLQQANYIRGQLRLYLRVTDAYGKPLRVCPIGKLLSFSRPEAEVDNTSRLHVLYQDGPRSFSYNVFDVQGLVSARQTYDYVTNRPHLRNDREGNISVAGGLRRVTPNDVPPPKDDDIDSPLPPVEPSTNTPPPAVTKKPR